jgi:hypothetical protein
VLEACRFGSGWLLAVVGERRGGPEAAGGIESNLRILGEIYLYPRRGRTAAVVPHIIELD